MYAYGQCLKYQRLGWIKKERQRPEALVVCQLRQHAPLVMKFLLIGAVCSLSQFMLRKP